MAGNPNMLLRSQPSVHQFEHLVAAPITEPEKKEDGELLQSALATLKIDGLEIPVAVYNDVHPENPKEDRLWLEFIDEGATLPHTLIGLRGISASSLRGGIIDGADIEAEEPTYLPINRNIFPATQRKNGSTLPLIRVQELE